MPAKKPNKARSSAGIQLAGISKSYGRSEILSGIDLHVKKGELLVVVGPSGCGKTTLLRMIAGLDQPDCGQVLIDGQRMEDVPPSKRGVAMVFQNYALYPHMNVFDNLAYALRIAKRPKVEIREKVLETAQRLRLDHYLERLPHALSGGQKQRVAIGRAMMRNPKLYLFDEPLSNLDAALRAATRVEIAQLKNSLPESTMIYVTHDQTEAMTLADRIVVLADHGIAQIGPPLELYQRPKTEFVARFIGSPSMNMLPATITGVGATTEVTLQQGGAVSCGLLRAYIATSPADLGKQVNVGLRPEELILCEHPADLTGTVELVEVLGDVSLLYVPTLAGQHLIVKLRGMHAGLKDRQVHLGVAASNVHLFHQGQSLRQ